MESTMTVVRNAFFIFCSCLPSILAAQDAKPFDISVSPVSIAVAREGITGAGSLISSGDRIFHVYPNHPDDFGGSAGTGSNKSADGGAKWSAGADDWPIAKTVDIWIDPLRDGRLIAFGIRWAPDPAKRGQLTGKDVPTGAYRVAFSTDKGEMWHEEEAVIDCPEEYGVIARPLFPVFEGNDGALHMPAYAWSRTGNRTLLLRCEDGGRKWRVRSVISSAADMAKAGAPVTTPWLETAIARVADGSWLAVVRTGSNAKAALMMSRSTDEGLTWSPVEKVLAGPEKHAAAGKLPRLVLLENGLLALLTAHSKNHCRLYVSSDGRGRSWSEGFIVTSQSGGNAALTAVNRDTLLVATPANGRIDSWRVTLRPEPRPVSPIGVPAKVTVDPATVRVAWQAPAGATPPARYRITPVMIAPPSASPDTEIFPYVPIETADASALELDLGRKLSIGGRYRVEVAAMDRDGGIGATATSAEFVVGAK
jgi:hypothetical protein